MNLGRRRASLGGSSGFLMLWCCNWSAKYFSMVFWVPSNFSCAVRGFRFRRVSLTVVGFENLMSKSKEFSVIFNHFFKSFKVAWRNRSGRFSLVRLVDSWAGLVFVAGVRVEFLLLKFLNASVEFWVGGLKIFSYLLDGFFKFGFGYPVFIGTWTLSSLYTMKFIEGLLFWLEKRGEGVGSGKIRWARLVWRRFAVERGSGTGLSFRSFLFSPSWLRLCSEACSGKGLMWGGLSFVISNDESCLSTMVVLGRKRRKLVLVLT